jgi:5-methyltetrahydropteroyltriglutamate--homocysteine methyltransferase
MRSSFRADHVGSLLRPPSLIGARLDGNIGPDTLTYLEDQAILVALVRQKAAGLGIFTDGEFRRAGFMSDFYESVEGLDRGGEVQRSWTGASSTIGGTSGTATGGAVGVAIGRLRQTKPLTSRELEFLREHAPGPIKVTLPSANQFPAIAYKKGVSDAVYPTYSSFLADIVPIIRREVQRLATAGVDYIQIDAPRYSYYIDPKWRDHIRVNMGLDPDAALDEAIGSDNSCFQGVDRTNLTTAIHLCRGNNRSQWYAEGGYDPIAEKLFNRLDVDQFLLEYESERAGTFEPLRFVPSMKRVVLGLVSTKVAALESQDDLLRRIDEASRFVPVERLALSPQCGFASAMEGNLLTEDDQWRKLELVVDTARKVWG